MVVGWRFCYIFVTNINRNLFCMYAHGAKERTNKLKYDLKTNY